MSNTQGRSCRLTSASDTIPVRPLPLEQAKVLDRTLQLDFSGGRASAVWLANPLESHNPAWSTEVKLIEPDVEGEIHKRCNLNDVSADVLSVQTIRFWVQDQLNSADIKPWNFQPLNGASNEFVRGAKNPSLTAVTGCARFPFISHKAPKAPQKFT